MLTTVRKHSNLIALGVAVLVILALGIVCLVGGEDFSFAETLWALVPPIVAIGLALITKEVYSSLFVGVVVGGLMHAKFDFSKTVDTVVSDGLISATSDTAGIFIFLVILGALVALVNKTGASAAFGRWAQKNIKTRLGACLATFVLGVLIFIDDYFNCLTVGSVMSPVTDTHKISRVKLAYLIDATAAPICMIAPISSWAAAVSSNVPADYDYSGIELFVRAIPFNFYSLLTLVFIVAIAIMGFDYGKMAEFEIKAKGGDLGALEAKGEVEEPNPRGRLIDLLLPVVVLVVVCILALLYVGGFFGVDAWGGTDYAGDFVGAFGNTDATIGLPWGALLTLILTIAYLLCRRLTTFKEAMECLPKGFIAMVPAILILTLATALKNVTGLLGADVFVEGMMGSFPETAAKLLPAVIFLVACVLAFSTGTSWGTFGILIPIVTAMFEVGDPLLFVGISACLAGAVCGDHCSPISDTTIMASAGANCNHVNHVSTQLPYAITVAGISFVCFILAGFLPYVWLCLPFGVALTVGTLVVIRILVKKKESAQSAE
jgi:Na+/H+ antiporter NhaC